MLTGKQKRYLRSLAHNIDPIFQIGKAGINDNMISQIDETLENRELIKIHILQNNFDDKNILFTTARKYKGLEADVIIIIDLDYSTFNKEENKRLFYVASSRAKNHLELNSQLNEEELEKLFLVVSNGRTKKINALIGDLKVSIR